jgi:tetratricopeptide (TPR) repeat protein
MKNETLERNIDQLVTRAHQPPAMDPAARERIRTALHARQAERREAEAKAPARARARTLTRARWPLVAAAAAMLAVGGGVGYELLRTGHESRLVDNTGVEPKRITVEASHAELILRQGAAVELVGPRRIAIVRGEVLFDVEPGHGELTVDTPQGSVRVIGTRFLLDSGPNQTSAAVVRGVVQLATLQGDVELHAGELGIMRGAAAPERRPAPRLSHLTSWAKQARKQAEGRGANATRTGALLARQPEGWGWNKEWPLPMRELTVDVHVEDRVARVALDQTFFNHVNQNLEGVYQFPLPHDAAISRLAMYVDGKRMESAIVERQRGRDVYESIVYRRRDPALLEWMNGNLFKVRIFPLRARQDKRILLSYTQTLESLYDGYRVEVPIPEIDDPVAAVHFRVRLADCAECDVTSSSHDIATTTDGDDAIVAFEATDHRIGDDLLLHVRRPDAAAVRVARNGDFLMASVQPDIDAKRGYQRRSWVVLYDTSASRSPQELEAQSFVVDHLLQELDEEDELAIIAFDATTRTMHGGFDLVVDADRRAVHKFLASEGGAAIGYTDLDAALAAAIEHLEGARAAPHILYVGDGMATGGARDLDALRDRVRGNATVVAVAVGDELDAGVMRALADETGGLFVAMNPGEDLAWRAFDLIATMNTPRVVQLSASWIDADGAALGAKAYTGRGQLADGEQVIAVGNVSGEKPAALRLAGTVDGDAWTRTYPVTASAGAQVSESGGYLPRMWAQRRIDDLLLDDVEAHEAEIAKLGMDNFLITPYTSLIVLENDKMYEQYKVSRDLEPGWAHYDAPDEIEVVSEPMGATPLGGAIDPRAVILRSPIELFYDYSQQWGNRWRDVDGRFAFDQGIAPARFATPMGGSGTGAGFGRRGGVGMGSFGGIAQGQHRIALTTEELTGSEDAGGEAFAPVVVTGKLGKRESSSWSVSKPGPGLAANARRDRDGSSPSLIRGLALDVTKDADNAGQSAKGKGKRKLRRRPRGPAYWGYGAAPQPAVYHWAQDPNLDDLTEFVPALFADEFDLDRLALARSAAEGSITDEARALIEKARGALAAQQLSFDGEVMHIDAQGRFAIERVTDTSLTERVVYDGESLTSYYPELDVAVRRDVGEASPALYVQYAPFIVPPADHLARWYTVSRTGARTLRFGLGEDTDAEQAYFEIELDDAYRVIALRSFAGGEATGAIELEYAPERVTIRSGDEARELARKVPADALDVSLPDAAVVEMPLRQPSHWETKVAGSVAGSPEWVHAQRQSLASYAALLAPAEQWKRLEALAKSAPELRRGDLVLASRGVSAVPDKRALDAVLAKLDKADPIARYARASWPMRHGGSLSAYRGLARDENGTLVGMLASYRGDVSAMRYGAGKSAHGAVTRFLDEYRYGPLRYVAAHRYNSYFAWSNPTLTTGVWDKLAEDDDWSYLARYEAARVLVNRGKSAEAVERFDALLREAREAGELPHIDYALRTAYYGSGRGQAGWRLLWSQWRAQVVRENDPEALLWFLQSSQMLGEHQDVDRVVAPYRGRPVDDVWLAIDLADALINLGRYDQAWVFLEPHAQTGDDANLDVVSRAAFVAEQQGRAKDAARYLERVLASDEPMGLGDLRAAYRRVIGLYGKLAHSPSSEGADALEGMLSAAADWRVHDPDNDEIDVLCASSLYALGNPEQGWRHLSSVIERHSGEGSAYERVASILENEGRLDEADGLWQQAIAVEPTNPTWLFRRSQNLVALDRADEARALLTEIEDGKWQDRFSNITWQAEHMLEQLAP